MGSTQTPPYRTVQGVVAHPWATRLSPRGPGRSLPPSWARARAADPVPLGRRINVGRSGRPAEHAPRCHDWSPVVRLTSGGPARTVCRTAGPDGVGVEGKEQGRSPYRTDPFVPISPGIETEGGGGGLSRTSFQVPEGSTRPLPTFE